MKWQGWQGWERHTVEIPGSELKRYVPLRRHGNGAKIMLGESQEEFGKEVISFYDPNANPNEVTSKADTSPGSAHITLLIVIYPGRLIVQ